MGRTVNPWLAGIVTQMWSQYKMSNKIKYSCVNCREIFTTNNFTKHSDRCSVKGGKISYNSNSTRNSLDCEFCGKLCPNKNSLRNHERLCGLNPSRQTTPFHDNGFQQNKCGNGGENQYSKALRLGLPMPSPSESQRQAARELASNRTPEWHQENGKRISETINSKVERGEWHTSLARNMHYQYRGEDFHGTWELSYAKYLDNIGKNWERNKKSFPYVFDGKKRRYTPDFYLPDEDVYIEIKGFTTDKDLAKWEQFPERLVVLTKTELTEMKII